jgi:hypothetical protein
MIPEPWVLTSGMRFHCSHFCQRSYCLFCDFYKNCPTYGLLLLDIIWIMVNMRGSDQLYIYSIIHKYSATTLLNRRPSHFCSWHSFLGEAHFKSITGKGDRSHIVIICSSVPVYAALLLLSLTLAVLQINQFQFAVSTYRKTLSDVLIGGWR